MIKDFNIHEVDIGINRYDSLYHIDIKGEVVSEYGVSNIRGIENEIMKFLMQKYYKDIPFEELDSTIREKYVEYFI